MTELELSPGKTLKQAVEMLHEHKKKTGEYCFCVFNRHMVKCTESVDEAYLRIIGRTYDELHDGELY